MAGNIILQGLHRLSLSKLLILGGFFVLLFQSLIPNAEKVGFLMLIIGFLIYFVRKQ